MLAREDLRRCELAVVPHAFVLSLVPIDQHYPVIMPLLLSVLQNAKGSEYHKLRLKAMECAGLIGEFCESASIVPPQFRSAIAVGRDVFREDSRKLCELLMQIQSEPFVCSLTVRRGNRSEIR